jgi:hypothetical protein
VKRTIKSVNAEGEETIRVEYHFGAKDVDRVEFNSLKQKKERDMRRNGQSAEGPGGAEEDVEDAQVGSTMASMSFNIGILLPKNMFSDCIINQSIFRQVKESCRSAQRGGETRKAQELRRLPRSGGCQHVLEQTRC